MDSATFYGIALSQFLGWRLHPGYSRPDSVRPSVEECVLLAQEATEEYEKWQLRQQQ